MKREEFIREFAEMLEEDPASLTADREMDSIANWDSVAYLSAMVLIDEQCGLMISADAVSGARKFGDILEVVQGKLD